MVGLAALTRSREVTLECAPPPGAWCRTAANRGRAAGSPAAGWAQRSQVQVAVSLIPAYPTTRSDVTSIAYVWAGLWAGLLSM